MLVSTVGAYSLGCVQLFVTPWTVARQSLSMRFPRQEYWSGLPFPSPGDLPYPSIKPGSPAMQADCLLSEPPGKPHGYGPWSHKELDRATNTHFFHFSNIF